MKAQLQSLVMGRVAVGQNGTSTKAAKNVRDAFDKLVELDKERDMLEFKFNECIKARQVSQSLLYRLDQVVASKQNETAEVSHIHKYRACVKTPGCLCEEAWVMYNHDSVVRKKRPGRYGAFSIKPDAASSTFSTMTNFEHLM